MQIDPATVLKRPIFVPTALFVLIPRLRRRSPLRVRRSADGSLCRWTDDLSCPNVECRAVPRQVTSCPESFPSAKGPPLCVQALSSAKNPPSTLNKAIRLPLTSTSRAWPGSISFVVATFT